MLDPCLLSGACGRETMVRIPTHGPPTHPGEMLLEEFLKPLGMTQVELAQRLGVSYPRVNELIHARRGVTPDTALRLERLFGMEAQFWLNLQQTWDLYQAMHSPAAKEIRKIKRLPELADPAGP
jgi:addiction module HigA family antidote